MPHRSTGSTSTITGPRVDPQRLVRVALAFALAATMGTAHALTAAELMPGLASVASSRARFVETRHSAMLKKPLVTSGQLAYQRPDRLEKHVQSPFEESITIDGSRVSITRHGSDRARAMTLPASGPAQALIESLRATLAGDLPALERHFAVSASGTPDQWTLSLTPRDPSLGAVVLRVDLAGRGNRLQRVEVVEAGGDRTVTQIYEEIR